MNPRLTDYLADPHDGRPLRLHAFAGSTEDTREGVLRNEQSGRWYPIRDGIPSLFADALREDYGPFVARFRDALTGSGCKLDGLEVSTQGAGTTAASGEPAASLPDGADDFSRIERERRARDEQAAQYDRMLSLKVYEYLESPAYRKALGTDLDSPLLEAGCGTGRFTRLFAEMASEVVAVDMSRDSILRNRVRHAGKTAAPVYYVHADLTHLPLRDAAFGRVAHCGVYEHIPSRALRQQFLQHARRALRPGGLLLLSAYRYGGVTRLFGKEGEHIGGIPFTRFTEQELRAEVESEFEIRKFRPNLGIYMSMLLATPRH